MLHYSVVWFCQQTDNKNVTSFRHIKNCTQSGIKFFLDEDGRSDLAVTARNNNANNNNNHFTALCPGLHGWASTRRNIHPPSTWSSCNLYELLPSTTIHSILPVQSTCLAIFLHNLSQWWQISTLKKFCIHVLTKILSRTKACTLCLKKRPTFDLL